MVRDLRAVITLAIDSLLDRARKGELSAIDIAILIDKCELLSGGVTARVEVQSSAEEQEAAAFYDSLLKLAGASATGMVLEAEIIPQIGAPGRRAAPAVAIQSQQSAKPGDQGPGRPSDTGEEPL